MNKDAAILNSIAGSKYTSFALTVDYDLTIEELIKRGKYHFVNSISSQYFPSERKGTKDTRIFLFRFKCPMKPEEVLTVLDERCFRAAETKELISFGNENPDMECNPPIVALGSVWSRPDCPRYAICLCGGPNKHFLDLFGIDRYRDWDYWFAAFRK